MKGLSLNQPYADLIVRGKKTIELRGWKTRYRGEFLVHASKKSMIKFVDEKIMKQFYPHEEEFVAGAIVGKAYLSDVKDYSNPIDEESDFINMDLLRRDADKHLAMGYEAGKTRLYGFIIENAVKFDKPIPYKGQLNFFEISKTIQSKLVIT